MNITEIRVKLVGNGNNEERLRAFCSVTLDGTFVIRDLKVIDGSSGPFVAMPSRKLSDRCPKCSFKNHLRARYCNECGAKLDPNRAPRDGEGRVKLHADVAHPINAAGREQIQREVILAYENELDAAAQPDYQPQSVDVEDVVDTEYDDFISEIRESVSLRPERATTSSGSRSRSSAPPAPERPRPSREDDRKPATQPTREGREHRATQHDRQDRGAPSRSVQEAAQPKEQDDPFSAGIF